MSSLEYVNLVIIDLSRPKIVSKNKFKSMDKCLIVSQARLSLATLILTHEQRCDSSSISPHKTESARVYTEQNFHNNKIGLLEKWGKNLKPTIWGDH